MHSHVPQGTLSAENGIHLVKFLGRSGSRINGVWKWVTRWRVGGDGGYRIIEVFSEKGGVNHA